MKIFPMIMAIVCMILLASCADAPKVMQGTVVSCDQENRVLAITDELDSGKTLKISYEGADVGADPNPGDTVRIAYREKDGGLRAMRIMNISRQK